MALFLFFLERMSKNAPRPSRPMRTTPPTAPPTTGPIGDLEPLSSFALVFVGVAVGVSVGL